MGQLTNLIESIVVGASAPGGGVHGEYRGTGAFDLYFSTGFYGRVSESELERRLEQVARLLWTGFTRRKRAVHDELGIHELDDDPGRDRVFYDERERIVAAGASDDGRISVSVEGMCQWRVVVTDGTVRTLAERDFLAGLGTAARRLVEDQSRQIMELRERVYA
ncbi:hypothetical protein [Actinoplanes sp. NPDC020271]|uniref:hypothetical protein n=1 Tax=Actinoplanes sp. NPDC020271 TaxID=3363896 RepID=UPI0037B3BCD1